MTTVWRIRGNIYSESSDSFTEYWKDFKARFDGLHAAGYNIKGKSYVAYKMAPLLMPLIDTEGHFCCLKPF